MPTLTIAPDGHAVAVTDPGGPGRPVVFAHGFGTSGALFDPQVAAFGDTWRCITYDLRAHGDSPAARDFTMWDNARDLLAILDALELERPVVVGTSQGGFVGLRAAMLAPDRLAGLAVLGSSAAAEDDNQRQAFLALAETFASEEDGAREAVVAVWATIVFGTADPGVWRTRVLDWAPEQMRLAVRALVDRDEIVSRLDRITTPTLVMHGTHDRSYDCALGEQIAAGLPDCRGFHAVEGGAHFLSWTDPEPVNAALATFVASCP